LCIGDYAAKCSVKLDVLQLGSKAKILLFSLMSRRSDVGTDWLSGKSLSPPFICLIVR